MELYWPACGCGSRALASAATTADVPTEWDFLTSIDRYNEALMTGLRTTRGINLDDLQHQFGWRPDAQEPTAWRNALSHGTIAPAEGGRWRIPEAMWLIGDAVAAEFFLIQD